MRVAIAVLFLTACGADPSAGMVAPRSPHVSALQNADGADTILGQLSERGTGKSRTDAGGFGSVDGVAVGLTNDQLWVADGANERVLGFANAAALADGASADVVLNQQDFFTTDHRQVPAGQQIKPAGVAVDPEGRVYVFSSSEVLVYEDPFSDDRAADLELTGVPATIQSVRALNNNNLAVVGINAIAFYERGSPDPYGQAGFAAPCTNSAYDIAEDGGVYFVACSGGLACSGGVGLCSGVAVYEVDSVTGFVERDDVTGLPVPHTAYTDLIGARSLEVNSNFLLVADTAGHRILRFGDPVTRALTVIGGGVPHTPANALTVYGQPDASTPPVPNFHSSGTAQVSNQGLSLPTFVAVSPVDRRMWVTDYNNNRVVAYSDIAGSSPTRASELVLGQPDAVHAYTNRLEPGSFARISGVALGRTTTGARAVLVDEATNRVLLYDDVGTSIVGDPTFVLGQSTALDYVANRASLTPPIAGGLSGPTHAAIGPSDGWIWVTDAGNARVLAFESPGNGADANRAFGAINLTSAGVYANFGAIAVSSDHLFVAAGNRVFMYSIASPGRKPIRVFGQEQPPPGDPLNDDIDNQPNRGQSGPRADTLSNVTGVAVDSAGRLWVADRGNHRVLWFNDPSSTTDALTNIVTADGVVGQRDFSTGSARMGDGEVNRYSFAGISDIAVTNDGTLWVADNNDHRVLAFFHPMAVDPTVGAPRADLVLGQDSFAARGANNAPNGVNGATLNNPFSIATDATGGILLVSDRGNNRALRFVDSQQPEVTGDGEHEVVRGETLVVTVTVTDPDGDSLSIDAVPPYVDAQSGGSSLSVPVTFVASENAPVGSRTVVNVVATDDSPRAQSTTFSVVFRVVDRLTEPTTGNPGAPRPLLDPEDGCVCSTGATALPWLVGLIALCRRRRR